MAQVRQDNIQLNLDVNTKSALVEIDNLQRRMKVLNDTVKGSKKDTQEYADAYKELQKVEKELKALTTQVGLNGLSIKQLNDTYRQLNREIKTLVPGTDAFVQKSEEIRKVRARLNEVTDAVKGVEQEMSLFEKAATFTGVQMGVEAVADAVIGFAVDSVAAFAEFEQGLSNLSAITGASTEDMEFFKNQALEIGSTTKLSATQAVEAFKLIGSAMPQLLSDKDGLVAVTNQAIALAEAAGMTLPEAANALGASLNQFGAGASEAARFVNVMAAGAKEGSAEINEVAASLKNSGTVAKAAGLSFEETNAAIQALASISIKGGEAGTGLRNVLLKLQSGADETNPKVVGLQKALENLGNQNLSAAELTKKFGAENIVVAQQLIDSRQKVTELTAAVTGSQEATRQQNANNDNLASSYERLTALVQTYKIQFVDTFDGALRLAVKGVTAFLLALKEVPTFLNENREAIILLGVAIATLNINNIRAAATALAHAAAEKARAIATRASTIATAALTAVMNANPYMLVISAIALLVAGFVTLYKNSETVRLGIAGIWATMKETASIAIDFFKALASGDFDKMAEVYNNAGDRMASAFKQGYNEKKAEEKAEAVAAAKEKVAAETNAETTAIKEGAAIKLGLLEEIDERIKVLREAQAKAQTAAQLKAISDEIKKVEELRDKLTGKADEEAQKKREERAKKAAEDRKKKAEQAAKDEADALKKSQDLAIQLILDDTARKEAQLKLQAEREIEAVNRTSASAQTKATLIAQIETKLYNDLADIQNAAIDAQEKKDIEFAEKQKQLAEKKALALLDVEILYAERSQNSGRRTLALIARLEKEQEIELANKALTEEEKLLIQLKYEDRIAGVRQKAQDDEVKQAISQAETIAQNAITIINGIADLRKLAIDDELAELQRVQEAKNTQYEYDKQRLAEQMSAEEAAKNQRLSKAEQEKNRNIELLNQQMRTKRISESEFNRLKAEQETKFNLLKTAEDNKFSANKEANEKRLLSEKEKSEAEYAKKERELKIKQFNIDKNAKLAEAIINGALAVIKASPNIPLMAIAGFTTAVNIAKINATKPTFAKGGISPVAGVSSGPSHGDGGINMYNGKSGEYMGQWEGGEPYMILSKNTYANNKGLVDSLIDSSLYRNGAPVMQRGGIFAEDGAMIGTPSAGQSPSAEQANNVMAMLYSAVMQLNQNLANPKAVKGVWDFNEFMDGFKEVTDTQNDANV
jgi:TP901 family phage tail tape measure protein